MAKSDDGGGNGFEVPFVFVKHGDPLPREWMARHPDWVKFPATLVVRREEQASARRSIPPDKLIQGDRVVDTETPDWMRKPAALGAPVRRRRATPINRLPPWNDRGAENTSEVTTARDAIEAYRQATHITDQAASTYLASVEILEPVDGVSGDARERAFLRLLRWAENGDVSDNVAYHARFGGHDPMSNADMLNYEPKEETFRHKNGTSEPVTAAGAYQITKETWNDTNRCLF